MPHMIPEYMEGARWRVWIGKEECGSFDDWADAVAHITNHGAHVDAIEVSRETGWWCRLSAPGYMDCTDWVGPYATEEDARQEIIDTWEAARARLYRARVDR